MSDPGRDRHAPLDEVLEIQRVGCELAGSARYAALLGSMIDDLAAGGITERLLRPHAVGALADAIPLRLMGAVHRIALRGDAPDLAAFYPSCGGTGTGDAWPAFLATMEANEAELVERLRTDNVQTNEVGRAAALVVGFHRVATDTGLPLRLCEVGSSAGLLLRWDHFGYDTGAGVAGDPGSPIRFAGVWEPAPPPFVPGSFPVAARRGCDIGPIDPTSDEGRLRLRSFLWPDQVDRRIRLDAAMDIAAAVPATVDRQDAGAWATERLAEDRTGTATVVFHSIVLQYLPKDTFRTLRAALLAAGERATPDEPLAWLRMEPAGPTADLRVTQWPGGQETVLGTCGYHGTPVWWDPSPA